MTTLARHDFFPSGIRVLDQSPLNAFSLNGADLEFDAGMGQTHLFPNHPLVLTSGGTNVIVHTGAGFAADVTRPYFDQGLSHAYKTLLDGSLKPSDVHGVILSGVTLMPHMNLHDPDLALRYDPYPNARFFLSLRAYRFARDHGHLGFYEKYLQSLFDQQRLQLIEDRTVRLPFSSLERHVRLNCFPNDPYGTLFTSFTSQFGLLLHGGERFTTTESLLQKSKYPHVESVREMIENSAVYVFLPHSVDNVVAARRKSKEGHDPQITKPKTELSWYYGSAKVEFHETNEYQIASSQNIGSREIMQDVVYVGQSHDPSLPLEYAFCLADGHGKKGAEVASQTIGFFLENLRQIFTKSASISIEEKLKLAVKKTQENLSQQLNPNNQKFDLKKDANKDGGTTLDVLIQINGTIYVVHIGDGRVYQFTSQNHSKQLVRLTKDHHWSSGDFSRGGHYYRHLSMLSRALGDLRRQSFADFSFEPDVIVPNAMQSGDIFLICSDGLTDKLSDSQIKSILSSHSIEDAARVLMSVTQDVAYDNVSFILLKKK